MQISLVVFGTRGDVQPTVALALELLKSGHEVKLCVPPEHAEWIKPYGCPAIPFGSNIREMIEKAGEKAGKPPTRPSVKTMKREIIHQIDELPGIVKGSDILIGVGLVHGVPSVAEKLNIPYRFMAFYPGIMGVPKDASFPGRLIWAFGKMATNSALRGLINKKRREIDLAPISDVWANWMGEDVILASEKSLVPVSGKVDFRFSQTGYLFLPSLEPLTERVERFLASGTPPVFIGFGSNPVQHPEKFSRMLEEVSGTTGRRLIISKGWGAIDSMMESDQCLFVDEVPYDLLFPRIAMAVHHGGIGTMAAAAKAGIPQACFPFMADQFMNRNEMVRIGISPETTSFRKLSARHLTRVILEGLSDPRFREKAIEIAADINRSNGTELTARLVTGVQPGAGP